MKLNAVLVLTTTAIIIIASVILFRVQNVFSILIKRTGSYPLELYSATGNHSVLIHGIHVSYEQCLTQLWVQVQFPLAGFTRTTIATTFNECSLSVIRNILVKNVSCIAFTFPGRLSEDSFFWLTELLITILMHQRWANTYLCHWTMASFVLEIPGTITWTNAHSLPVTLFGVNSDHLI